MKANREIDPKKRGAILMMSLGEDAAAEVFKYLTAREVKQVGGAMASLTQATRDDVAAVMEAFREDADQCCAVTLGADEYIRNALTKALGAERATGLINDILDAGDHGSEFDTLNWPDPATVAELIGTEHPQIIATILVHMETNRAAGILGLLDERVRNDVMLRIATFGGVQPAALTELTTVLGTVLAGQGTKRAKMGGIRTAAEILNMMNAQQEEAAVTSLRENDADLAQRVLDEMFVFANLIDLDDRHIQVLLKEVDSTLLMVALKGVPDDLREKFLRNMSSRAADMLREDLAAQGPVLMSKVEAEQKKILQAARRLAESGQIELGSNGDDAYV